MFSAMLTCLALTCASSDTPTTTFRSVKKGYWEADVKSLRFKGDTTLYRHANEVLRGDAQALFDAFVTSAKDYLKQTGETATWEPRVWNLATEPEVHVRTSRLISTRLVVSSYTGGAHPNTTFVFRTFGLVGGKAKTLNAQDFFRHGVDARRTLSAIVIGKLKQDEAATWVQTGEVAELDGDRLEMFVVTRRGFRYLFQPYEMGPYVSGSFAVDVPWRELAGKLDLNGPLKGLAQ